MFTTGDQDQLKACLTKTIELVDKCSEKLKPISDPVQAKKDTKEDDLLENYQASNNVSTFALNKEDDEHLCTLTSDIETVLSQHISHLSHICLNYLFDFFHIYNYDREQKIFTSPLNRSILDSLHSELESLLAAVAAYPAAYNGDLQTVTNFLEKYPNYKDKPGLWGTTLLYSTARNNHFNIVKYLIESAHSSVNAQNQRDVDFALESCKADFVPNPTAGSTALHAACYNKHLKIVEYLIEHGADYFIENQANETPVMNGERSTEIKNYFRDYLILNYSAQTPKNLPDRPIMNDSRRPIQDCWWEYKPFQDSKWFKFNAAEALELHQALLTTEEFQEQVYLKVEKGLYSVSMIEFHRSGRHEQDPKKNMAWVRCRGSSILNFDCYSIWQIMLIQHGGIDKAAETTPSLKVQHFPTMSDSRFKLQLNSWYSCDAKTNSLLENSMNYRRKITALNVPFVGNHLKFNLGTFEFSNNEKTILGYVRWIPRLISKTGSTDHKIVDVDNYQVTADSQPIPLTTKRLKEISHVKKSDQEQTEELANSQEDDDDDSGFQTASSSNIENDDDIDDENTDKSNDGTKVGEKICMYELIIFFALNVHF